MKRLLAALLSVVVAAPSWAVPAAAPVLPPVAAGAPRGVPPPPEDHDAWAADAQLVADHLEAGDIDEARRSALRAGFLELRGRWQKLPKAERDRLAGLRERLSRAGKEVLGEEPIIDPDEPGPEEPTARRDLDSVSDSVERAALYFDQARAGIPGGAPAVVVPGPGAEPPAVFRLTHPKRPQPGARIHVGRGLAGVPPEKRRAKLRALAAAALGALGRGAPPPETLEGFVDWLEDESKGPGGRLRRDLVVEVAPDLQAYARLGWGSRRPGPRLKPWDTRRPQQPPSPSAPVASVPPPAPAGPRRTAGKNHFAQRIKLGKGFGGGGGGGGGGSRRSGGRRGGGRKAGGGGGAKGGGGGGISKRDGNTAMSGRAPVKRGAASGGGGQGGGRGGAGRGRASAAGAPANAVAAKGGPMRAKGKSPKAPKSSRIPAVPAAKAVPKKAAAPPPMPKPKPAGEPQISFGPASASLPSLFRPFTPPKAKAPRKKKASAGAVKAPGQEGGRVGLKRPRPPKLVGPGGKRGLPGKRAAAGELRAPGREAGVRRERKKVAAAARAPKT